MKNSMAAIEFCMNFAFKGCFVAYKVYHGAFDNTLTSEDIMAASVNIFRGRDILKMQKFVQKLHEI